jgi:hypothetical protein
MTEELKRLFVRSRAAIREAERLVDINREWQIYNSDTVERIFRRAHFEISGQKLEYPRDMS